MAVQNCLIPDRLPHQSTNQPVRFGEVRGARPTWLLPGRVPDRCSTLVGEGGLGSGASGVPYLPCCGPGPRAGPAGSPWPGGQVRDRRRVEGFPGPQSQYRPPGLSGKVLGELAAAGTVKVGEWEDTGVCPSARLGHLITATCANPVPATQRTLHWGSGPTQCQSPGREFCLVCY